MDKAPQNYTYHLSGATTTFPFRQSDLAFEPYSLSIINNTPAAMFFSKRNPTPTNGNCDFAVPPRSSRAYNGWYTRSFFVGTDGVAIASGDFVDVEMGDNPNPFAGSALPISASQIRSVQHFRITDVEPPLGGITILQVIASVTLAKTMIILRGATIGITGTPDGGGTGITARLVNPTRMDVDFANNDAVATYTMVANIDVVEYV